jgi:hypothetical protein
VWVLVPAMLGSLGAFVGGASFELLSYFRFPVGFPRGGLTPVQGIPGLPQFDTAPAPYFLFLLVPVVSTVLGGWWSARKVSARSRGEGAAVGALAGVVFAVAVTLLIVLSSVGIGFSGSIAGFVQNQRGHLGPNFMTGALLALVWGVVGGALGGMLAGWRRARPEAAPVDTGFGGLAPSPESPPAEQPRTGPEAP